MIRRIEDGYIYSTAVILFVTAMIKFTSAAGNAPILDWLDSLLPLTNRTSFILAGVMEVGLSTFLFLGNERPVKISVIAWLSLVYLIYRLGLLWAGFPNICSCLGNLNERFPISPAIENTIAWTLLVWLLIGSHLFGVYHLTNRRNLKSSQVE